MMIRRNGDIYYFTTVTETDLSGSPTLDVSGSYRFTEEGGGTTVVPTYIIYDPGNGYFFVTFGVLVAGAPGQVQQFFLKAADVASGFDFEQMLDPFVISQFPATALPNAAAGAAAGAAVVGSEMALTSGERTSVATAWGARDLGNGRTADMYLQGLVNKIGFAVDGLSATLYSTDDTTPLKTFATTRNPLSLGGLKDLDPA